MNLQENIRKALREEYTERQMKILNLASKVGFLKASKMFGGIKELLNILGNEFLTTNNKIKIIQEIVEERSVGNYMILNNEVVLKNTGEEYSQIERINREGVDVYHYGGPYYEDYLGNTKYHYEELPKNIIDVLFNEMI